MISHLDACRAAIRAGDARAARQAIELARRDYHTIGGPNPFLLEDLVIRLERPDFAPPARSFAGAPPPTFKRTFRRTR